MRNPVNVPGRASRLFDLVVPTDEVFRCAFYFALKDTLVVADLDTATEVAYENGKAKWKVVTEDGGVIDTSGAMSGGGQQQRRGQMNIEGSAKAKAASKKASSEPEMSLADVKRLEAAKDAAQQKLNQCRSTKVSVEGEIKAAHSGLKALSTEVQKLSMALSGSGNKEDAVVSRITEVEADQMLSPLEQQQIEEQGVKLQEIDEEIARRSPNLSTYRSNVTSMQRRIMDVGGPKLARAQGRLEILTKKFDELTATLAKREAETAAEKKVATKASSTRADKENEKAKIEEKQASLKAEQAELEVCLSLIFNGYLPITVMWSGALDSYHVLRSYPIITIIAYNHHTDIDAL